ncbi:hypothetical protein C0Q70_14648 [Pomacea canaliculata]|uniref:Uncharacterized protein n=1 Tax=Pomacea canaliculata TaxID=400727 RepID=A0A2T7NSP4_POMCA|nr:hypothetical protein C0Q70_14648 [Pomacea canaliculata]
MCYSRGEERKYKSAASDAVGAVSGAISTVPGAVYAAFGAVSAFLSLGEAVGLSLTNCKSSLNELQSGTQRNRLCSPKTACATTRRSAALHNRNGRNSPVEIRGHFPREAHTAWVKRRSLHCPHWPGLPPSFQTQHAPLSTEPRSELPRGTLLSGGHFLSPRGCDQSSAPTTPSPCQGA